MEQPVLKLALLGFSDTDKRDITQAIGQTGESWPTWELVDFEQADAWCIHGAAVERLQGNTVQVRTLQGSQPLISLDPRDITRPIAFTEPMPAGLEGVHMVNLRSPQLLRVGLQRFEGWLRLLRAQFALGSVLVERQAELKKGIHHVLDAHGKLLAVVNLMKWTVALLPNVRPIDFDNANWAQRPNMAADIPAGFTVTSVTQLMWTYAVRTTQDVLPARYRRDMVYLRMLPQLPAGLLQDEHLVTLRALSTAPAKFAGLLATTQLSSTVLARSLAALYFAGAVTTQKTLLGQAVRSASPLGEQSSLPPDSGTPSEFFTADGPENSDAPQPTAPPKVYDATAPAPLFSPKFF
jgi:hypothetical protein